MKSLLVTVLFTTINLVATQSEDFDVSGPLYVESNRDPKFLSFKQIHYFDGVGVEESLHEAEESIEEGINTAETFVKSNVDQAKSGFLGAVNATERSVSKAASDVSTGIKSTMSTLGNKVQKAASQTKSFIRKSSKDAGGFLSSTYNSVKDWFSQLENEAKELMHFILRVIEVLAVLVILGLFIWIFRRVASAFKFLKGVAESFEMGDVSAQTV